jgi:ankyrin repeat protein
MNNELFEAAREGNLEEIKQLIAKGVDVNVKDNEGWTALMDAAGKGHVACVRMLLDAGADVNAKTDYGYTAMYWATGYGRVNVIHELSWFKRNSMIALRNYLLNLDD